MDIGPSEAETFWTEFLRKLRRRGLRGVKLVISDAHEGIKAAVARLMNATWQRRRVHTMRNALAHAGKSSRRVVSAFMATAFAQDSAEAAKTQCRKVADQLRPKLPKLAAFMDEAEDDVLAYMSFPADHWSKIHSTNGLERLNGEVKRRTEVVGIVPNDDAIVRLVGAILLEQNDEWAVQRARYKTQPLLRNGRKILGALVANTIILITENPSFVHPLETRSQKTRNICVFRPLHRHAIVWTSVRLAATCKNRLIPALQYL